MLAPTTGRVAAQPDHAVDAAALTGEFAEDLASEFRQAIATGVNGWFDDELALTRPSSFDLADFAVPTYLW